MIRGRVLSDRGAALIGVRVGEEINQQSPVYGFTITRGGSDGGAFDLLVNGGQTITLQFMRKPFDKLERRFYVPWNEIIYIGDIRMHRTETTNVRQSSLSNYLLFRQSLLLATTSRQWRSALPIVFNIASCLNCCRHGVLVDTVVCCR